MCRDRCSNFQCWIAGRPENEGVMGKLRNSSSPFIQSLSGDDVGLYWQDQSTISTQGDMTRTSMWDRAAHHSD